MLRAAGDNDGADDLLLELNEIDDASDDPAPVVVVEVESAGDESGEGVVTNAPPVAGETEVIAAEAAAQIAVIEATADAQIAVMEAAAEIEAAADEREAETLDDVVIVADATADPEPDPEPRTTHWFYREFGRSRD
jgi:hypothetical protein